MIENNAIALLICLIFCTLVLIVSLNTLKMSTGKKADATTATNGAQSKGNAVAAAVQAAKANPRSIEEIEAKIEHFLKLAETGRARDRWARKAEELKAIKSELDDAKNLTNFENSDFNLLIRNPFEKETFKISNQSVVADFCDFLLERIALKIEELDIELMSA